MRSPWRLAISLMLRAIVFAAIAIGATTQALGQGERAISVTAGVTDQRVYVGEPFQFYISVNGSQSPSAPDLSSLKGFEVKFLGGRDVSRSFTSIVNGRRTDEVFRGYQFYYELTPLEPGEWLIPPLELSVDGLNFRTEAIPISVFRPQNDPDMLLRLESDQPEVYEGEPIFLRLVWSVNKEPTTPRFTIPAVAEFFEIVGSTRPARRDDLVANILDVDVPLDIGEEVIDGVHFQTFTGTVVLLPRTVGEATIGPATVSSGVTVRRARGFFSQNETRRVVVGSNSLLIRVKPLPSDGRPSNFTGLVGRYRLGAVATPTEVNVGDPITLQLQLSGPLAGTAPAPALTKHEELARNFRIADESTTTASTMQNKAWSRTLRALRDDVTYIPAIEVPFFDPKSGAYEIARSEPISLTVRPTRQITAADAVGGATPVGAAQLEESIGGIRHNYSGVSLLADHSFNLRTALLSPLGLLTMAAPPVAYAGVGVLLLARRVRGKSESARRRRRRAQSSAIESLSRAESGQDISGAVSAAIRGYFADCFNRQATALTADDCAALVPQYADDHARAVRSLLNRCDAARFGAGSTGDAQLIQEAKELVRTLDGLIEGSAR